MRKPRQAGLAAAIIGIASAGTMFVSAGTASANFWSYIGTFSANSYGSGLHWCAVRGSNDVSAGIALDYYCQPISDGTAGLYEYLD